MKVTRSDPGNGNTPKEHHNMTSLQMTDLPMAILDHIMPLLLFFNDNKTITPIMPVNNIKIHQGFRPFSDSNQAPKPTLVATIADNPNIIIGVIGLDVVMDTPANNLSKITNMNGNNDPNIT